MSSGKHVFLLGPGFIGREVIDRLQAEFYTVTTLIRREEAAPELNVAGIKTVLGNLDSSEIITKQASLADIVIHTATADHLASVEAVLAGIESRGERPSIYIHNSGSGVLNDDAKGSFKSETIYSDDGPEQIDTLSDSAPHRSIDLAIIRARKRLTNAKIAIILPPVIYGVNPEYKRQSIQMPTLTRFSLKHGYAGHIGDGLAVWNAVHVADLARAYMTILHWLENSSKEEVLKNPYFFCENGQEFAWKEAASTIGKALHSAGKLKSPGTGTIPDSDYEDLFGPDASAIVVGSNSRSRANRLRSLGWLPREKGLFQSLVEDEIPLIVQETGEFRGYAQKAA